MKANELLSNCISKEKKIPPNPIDKRVGSRIRLRRKLLGFSQEKLAIALGLSFQQIQKHEKGFNRVGASRLYYIAQFLQVPINFFFDEFLTGNEENKSQVPPSFSTALDVKKILITKDKENAIKEEIKITDLNVMNNKETVDLLKAYYHIKDKEIRKKLLHLIKVMAE